MAGTALLLVFSVGCGANEYRADAAFRLRANRICRALDRQTRALDPNLPTRAEFHALIGYTRAAGVKFARLHPPAADERLYRDFVTRWNRIAAFQSAHEAKEWAYMQRFSMGHLSPAVLRRIQRFYRDLTQDARIMRADVRRLRLQACIRMGSPR